MALTSRGFRDLDRRRIRREDEVTNSCLMGMECDVGVVVGFDSVGFKSNNNSMRKVDGISSLLSTVPAKGASNSLMGTSITVGLIKKV